MPALIPRESEKNNAVWVCSDCDAVFTASHPRDRLAPGEITRLNTAFIRHCRRHHRNTVIVPVPEAPDPSRFGRLMRILEWLKRRAA